MSIIILEKHKISGKSRIIEDYKNKKKKKGNEK